MNEPTDRYKKRPPRPPGDRPATDHKDGPSDRALRREAAFQSLRFRLRSLTAQFKLDASDRAQVAAWLVEALDPKAGNLFE